MNELEDIKENEREDSPKVKTLGMLYERDTYKLLFPTVERSSENTNIRRNLLAQLHRMYDPLGLISPFVFEGKRLIQESWLTGAGWDEALPEDICLPLETWKEEIPKISQVGVPRCLVPFPEDHTEVTLHTFTDASEHGYGAATYCRVKTKEDEVFVQLICSKTRVAPTGKKRSIPELELMGAMLCCPPESLLQA